MTESPKIGIKCSSGSYFRLSFRNGGRDKILLSLKKVLRAKEWEKSKNVEINQDKTPENINRSSPNPAVEDLNSNNVNSQKQQQTEQPKNFSTRNAGVGGILRKKTEQSTTTDAQLKEAFKDIDALMIKAKDMVDLAKNLSKMSSDQNADLREFMISMGIDNPVTKYIFYYIIRKEI